MYTGEWWSPAQLIMDTIIYFFQEGEGETVSSAQSYLIPLPRLLSYYLLHRGHQLPESNRRMASHTYVIDQWDLSDSFRVTLTTHGTRRKRFAFAQLAVPISTLAVLISDLPRPSQPQVVDATPSTLSIMACLDTLQELFVSMDSHIDARLRLTPPMVQGASEVVTPIVEITDQATTPMLEDIAQVATPVLEEIDGLSILSLVLDVHFYIYLIRYGSIHYGIFRAY
ncbi:hypothetical protein CK203_055787 [Vitis vinifera]|uniref:Uncharacterized protein n=1 Tax=Vitis vinifera TaxID=29760 RepID=A0A438H240_VITVI|nr:hypothetical protein CK203_055787 [Vitis vinifera]